MESSFDVKLNHMKIDELYRERADDIIKEVSNVDPVELQKTVGLGRLYKGTGYELVSDAVEVKESLENYEVMLFDEGKVYLKTEVSKELYEEAMLREVARRLQMLRKENGLVESDTIAVSINASTRLAEILQKRQQELKGKVNAKDVLFTDKKLKKSWAIEEETLSADIKKEK